MRDYLIEGTFDCFPNGPGLPKLTVPPYDLRYKEIGKIYRRIERWIKAKWTDYRKDGSYFGPEAASLMDQGYNSSSYDPGVIKFRTVYYESEDDT